MDTEDKYLETEFYVVMAGGTPPHHIQDYQDERIADPDDSTVGVDRSGLRDHRALNEDVPIDGQIRFYWPDRMEPDCEEGWKSFEFPFRSVEKDDAPWAAYPDKENFSQHPVWEWQNPNEDPHEKLTLKPSIGVGSPLTFHCFVRDGEVEWI